MLYNGVGVAKDQPVTKNNKLKNIEEGKPKHAPTIYNCNLSLEQGGK